MKRLNKQIGISLVEILVALVISLFLLGGIVQVYIGNKTTFSFTNALAEVQENGRFALDTMSQDLRLTNQWGCISFDPDDTDNINDTLDAGSVIGYDADFHDFLDEEAIEGTDGGAGPDTLIIRGGKPGQTNVRAPFTASTVKTITTNKIRNLSANDIILLARCGANDLLIEAEADILSVDSVDNTNPLLTTITLESNKSQQFENDAMIIELQTVTYSIGAGASGEPALFRREFNGANEELVEGVESMQVLYGVDDDDDQFPNQYVRANLVGDFEDVVSVRIMLLLRSIDDFVTEAPQTYTYNGTATTPADRRLRQVFTTTIALRNRIGSS
jgi:type IV pilus assembly protein PilW